MGLDMSRGGRLVLGWCAVYTAAAPQSDRERRREEIRSHVWETLDACGTGWRPRLLLAAACARGAIADLVWCNEVRRAQGLSPLIAAFLVSPVSATAIGGVLILAAFAASTLAPAAFGVANPMVDVTAALAAAFVSVSVTDRAYRRLRSRQTG